MLVRAGKLNDAQKILERIWDRKDIKSSKKQQYPKKVMVESKEIKIDIKENKMELSELTKIKGIGKKTVEDIKIMFNNIEELKEALKENKVALRDDIVYKLKGELLNESYR